MKRASSGFTVAAAVVLALLMASVADAVQLPPKGGCVTSTLKTVRQGNRLFESEAWFTSRIHRAGCLARAKPKQFNPFSKRCRVKSDHADSYLSTLQEDFIMRLDELLLRNQPRLLRLDRRELSLLSHRKEANRRLRHARRGKRASIERQIRRIDHRLVTIQAKRARINYSMNTRAITRRGAAGVWLAYFDGVASGCLKAFRGSPYQTVMREHFLVQLAAAQYVSPPPTRSNIATWANLFSARTLTLAG